MAITCHPDAPCPGDDAKLQFRDLLDSSRYAVPLVDLIASPTAMTPLTVGIFGPWGSGKTTLLGMIEREIRANRPDEFVLVPFNPWVHRRESNMLVPLLHCLNESLETWKDRVAASAKKIFEVLARLGADVLLKSLTLNAVDLDRLEKLEKSYLEHRQKVESQMRNLRSTLATLAKDLARSGKKGKPGPRLVFLIDDLDRCQPDEIIDVLESVKLFLDVENVVVILAVDKEVIDRGIEVRYTKFEFAKERAEALGAEYLEKMVQIPLSLLPLDVPQVDAFLKQLPLNPALAPHTGLLAKLLVPNPRKVKRVLNNLELALAVAERTKVSVAPILDPLIRLAVLQAQDGALYDKVARQPELLDALQIYYDDSATGKKPDLTKFKERREGLEALCQKYHRPGTYLARLFEGKPFQSPAKGMPPYLTLLAPTGSGGTGGPGAVTAPGAGRS
jgi:hypothetical protein